MKDIRLKKHFYKYVVPAMKNKFAYKNIMQVPKLIKVVINVGLGEAVDNIKILDSVLEELANITGQKAVITRAKKSISTFKIRQGVSVGCKVTLRGARMYEFMDRMISMALPRIRDFKGLSTKSFDGNGNYTFGVKEQLIFPEIAYDKVQLVHGMDITVVTSAYSNDECKELLSLFGIPFQKG